MVKKRLRTIIVVILLILTVVLAGAAVYVGYQLQKEESEAPEDTEATTAGYPETIDCDNNVPTVCIDNLPPDGTRCRVLWEDNVRAGDGNCTTTTGQWFGGWPDGKPVNDTSTVAGWDECKITRNPCVINTGYDSYCICNKKEQKCPYSVTRINVKKDVGDWVDSISDLKCGESFTVRMTHNQAQNLANDMVVTVKGPDGNKIKDITASGATVTTSAAGTYTLTAKTLKKVSSTDYYSEAACKDTTTVTCIADVPPECGDGTLDTGEECETGIACTTAGEICDEATCLCSGTTPDIECEDLSRVGTDPVGTNEVELFTVRVTGEADQVPYANSLVRLRISSSADDTPVGEDYYTSEDLVSPVSTPGYDPIDGVWIYTFAWRATGLTDGTYDVEVSFDTGATWDTTPACELTFTFDDGEEVEPTFLIIKTASASCSSTSGAVINYTLTVTNLGPGSGTLDYVEDDLDTGINDSWVSDIISSKGVTGGVSNGVVTWTGTEEQRTYTANESATFTYTVTIPAANLSTFAEGVENVATVVYGDDQVRYNLVTDMSCPPGTLPSTGILDNTPWIVGTFALIIGIVAFRMGAGQKFLYPVIKGSKFEFLYAMGLNSVAADQKKNDLEEKYTVNSNSSRKRRGKR